MKNVQELLKLLVLEDLSDNTFKGSNSDIGSPNVFGGQVLAQSLNAAYRTMSEDRILHSLHSYFLEPGNLTLPIIFKVQNVRDGGSFSTRRVTAIQGEKIIFILACSFHKKEAGHEHQISIPNDLKQPEELLSWTDLGRQYNALLPKGIKQFLSIERPVEFKPTRISLLQQKDLPPYNNVWLKLKGDVQHLELSIKQQLLTYVSDYNILSTSLNPNASKANFKNTIMASLDHSMWFYRDFDINDWLLYAIDTPSSGSGRGFSRGNIFTRDGTLVASVAQEGLLRIPKNV